MKKHTYNEFFAIINFAVILLISGCDSNKPDEPGFFEGTISIGPICPVERIPPDPACLPTAETYKAYPVSVFTSDGKKKIVQINPSLDGSFNSELPQGTYLVVLEKAQNNIGGSNLPVEVSITAKKTTVLSINIDTGIR